MHNFFETRCKLVVENLKKNDFDAIYCSTAKDALEEVLKHIPEGAKVGICGSITIRQLGLVNLVKEKNCQVFDNWEKGLSEEKILAIRKSQLTADILLTSTNAITLKGELINIDNSGNRVASMIFGPAKIIVIAGANKIVTNIESAIDRIKNFVTPQIAGYLGLNAPCVKTAKCVECASEVRCCRVTTIMQLKPRATRNFLVIVVAESLGF